MPQREPLLEKLRREDPAGFMDLYIKVKMEMVKGVTIRQDFVINDGYDPQNNTKHIPIIINNFNRLSCLISLVGWLEERGYSNLYVIDNASTYPPLLEWYSQRGMRVFYLNTNVGYLALWKTSLKYRFIKQYYAYTDPDILPDASCPEHFLAHFKSRLESHPQLAKVGFGLHINDLPDQFKQKQAVIEHEKEFWENPLDDQLYRASIDTTFALYRPKMKGGWWLPAARTASPFLARHLPWYQNSAQPDEEEIFYRKTIAQSTHWTRKSQ